MYTISISSLQIDGNKKHVQPQFDNSTTPVVYGYCPAQSSSPSPTSVHIAAYGQLYEFTEENLVERAIKCIMALYYIIDASYPQAYEQLMLMLQVTLLSDNKGINKLSKSARNLLVKLNKK